MLHPGCACIRGFLFLMAGASDFQRFPVSFVENELNLPFLLMLSTLLIALIALLHLYFMWFEMFAWETTGKRAFGKGLSDQYFRDSKTLAANQGLYNGFLAAGLIWSLLISNPEWSVNVALFFLSCVLVAGLYGAYSVGRRILFIQALPAALAILAVLFQHFIL